MTLHRCACVTRKQHGMTKFFSVKSMMANSNRSIIIIIIIIIIINLILIYLIGLFSVIITFHRLRSMCR